MASNPMFDGFLHLIKVCSRNHTLHYRVKCNGRVVVIIRDMENLTDTQWFWVSMVEKYLDMFKIPYRANSEYGPEVWAVIYGRPIEYWYESDC